MAGNQGEHKRGRQYVAQANVGSSLASKLKKGEKKRRGRREEQREREARWRGKGVLTREIRRRRWDKGKREEKRERARSERKDVNPFLVSLQPIPPFLLIAGVLLSTGELYLLFLLPLHSLFPPRHLLSLSLQPPLRSLYPESSPFVPLAPPSRSLLLVYTRPSPLYDPLPSTKAHSPLFAFFLLSLLVEGRTKITNPRGICREPRLDRGVSLGRARTTRQPSRFLPRWKCLTLPRRIIKEIIFELRVYIYIPWLE